MTVEEALAEVCDHFCGAPSQAVGRHDDACSALALGSANG